MSSQSNKKGKKAKNMSQGQVDSDSEDFATNGDRDILDEDTDCAVCGQIIPRGHQSIQCDIGNCWVHLGCTTLTKAHYKILRDTDDSVGFFCAKCKGDKRALRASKTNWTESF